MQAVSLSTLWRMPSSARHRFAPGFVRSLVHALPCFERDVILLRYGFDGPELSPAVVARVLDAPTAAVEAAEEQALERLRRRLAVGAVDTEIRRAA